MTEDERATVNETSPHAYDKSIFATSRIDPAQHKAASNAGIYDRTKYAVAGLLFSLRRERSVRNIFYTTIIVIPLAIWLRLDRVRVLMVFISLAMIWVAELLNSAVEAVVDLVTPRKRHDMAKVAKDVAASATFVATITAIITSMVLLLPPLVKRLLELLAALDSPGNRDS